MRSNEETSQNFYNAHLHIYFVRRKHIFWSKNSMAEKIKSVQPKTGKNHKMFGSRFLRLHNFRNPRWTVQDKYAQYEMLTTLHGNCSLT